MVGPNNKLKLLPYHVMVFIIGYLILGWGLFYLIDVSNIFSIRDIMVDTKMDIPIIWIYLFGEAGVTEVLQWTALTLTTIISVSMGFKIRENGSFALSMFWLVMGFAVFLMFIEDAFNTRHFLAGQACLVFNQFDSRNVRILTEIVYFVILASIPLYALFKFGSYPMRSVSTRFYLLIGFLAYGFAGLLNATRFIKDWYVIAGRYLSEVVFKGELLIPYFWNHHYMYHHLIDYLFEESVELIGAGALFAASLAYLREIEKSKKIKDKVGQ